MQSILKPQPNYERPKRTFRNVLSGLLAFAALSISAYDWIAFPAPYVRKELQLIGAVLLVLSLLLAMCRRSGLRLN